MKKIFAIIMCLVLTLPLSFASATEAPVFPFDFPGEDGRGDAGSASSVSEAVLVNVNGRSIMLGFDPASDFSYVRDGLVQASFYAYGPDGQYLYELYMTFPETVAAGTVFTPDQALEAGKIDCCVVMLISTQNTEDLYVAAQYNDGPYPPGTGYTIRFDDITDTDGGRRYSGSVSATMAGEDINGAVISEKLTITEAPFSFTLPGTDVSVQPHADAVPEPFATPVPTATPRPDMFRI